TQRGSYRLIELPARVADMKLPKVQIVNLIEERRKRYQNTGKAGVHLLSIALETAIRRTLSDGGQIMLLLNRRGFSTHIQCPSCGHVVRCPDCDIALTHHRQGEKAVCHYCDFQIRTPTTCPECTFDGIRFAGLGTQRLEAEVRGRFPHANVLRMDSDTMQKPGSHERALERFRTGEVQILLGTQMIAKGLDFPNVTLVGVINADTALHLPDFRAAERTFQLVTQVAGRTGRGEKGGRVLVQTFTPEHTAIQAALRHDFTRFADSELPARKEFAYPPWTSMIRIVIRGPSQSKTEEFAKYLTQRLHDSVAEQQLEARILGPAPAPIEKLRGKFRFHTLLSSSDAAGLRAAARQATEDLKPPEGVQWIVDVDPVDML
ncbi:MAG: primosomal protein N', partial [Planctomycetes bacterium]|nr:primosomal protein N' [Planctomycetota bacterium]